MRDGAATCGSTLTNDNSLSLHSYFLRTTQLIGVCGGGLSDLLAGARAAAEKEKLANEDLRKDREAQKVMTGSSFSFEQLFAHADQLIREKLFRMHKRGSPHFATTYFDKMQDWFGKHLMGVTKETLQHGDCMILINRIPNVLYSRRSACDLAMKRKTKSKSLNSCP